MAVVGEGISICRKVAFKSAAKCDRLLSALTWLCLQVRAVAARRRDTVCVSGKTGEGLSELLDLLSAKLALSMVEVGLDPTAPCVF
jgi:hypothetical protein